ncbi:MAG: GNAT family N-acetyltransferase [Gammaproteobacteria bacterium]|jgi:ribosomal protein S18 acetylase RimI-like enzyme
MVDVKIRVARLEDADAIGALIFSLASKFITPEFSAEAEQEFLSSNDGKSVADNMNKGFSYFVAEDKGRLAGVVGIKDNSHIYHLFVAEEYQGQGLATRLWSEARDECRREDKRKTITVNSSNNAVGFYERSGFVRKGAMVEHNGVLYNPMEHKIGR